MTGSTTASATASGVGVVDSVVPDETARTSLTGDTVFGDDGGLHQLATVTADARGGDVANLTIGV